MSTDSLPMHLGSLCSVYQRSIADRHTLILATGKEKERTKNRRRKKKNADIAIDGDADDSKSMDETKVLKISLELFFLAHRVFQCYSIHFGLKCSRGAVANVFIIRQNRQTRSHLDAHISIELPIAE